MAGLNLEKLCKSYGKTKVLHDIDLDIKPGEFVVFVGPSGCGKSTLLRTIAGLEEITSGKLLFDGEDVTHHTPKERGIAMVFQSYALYPHMTVRENMEFGLKLDKASKTEMRTRVDAAAEMLQLTPLLDRLPKQLSGGQRQRVAIGRAITRDPRVFLFDEPLSNLDAALRVRTRIEIAALHERMEGATMIYVTHDQVEAMTLADRIVVLNAGRVEQVGAPMELYRNPANEFVARFIGSPSMNVLPASASGAQVTPEGGMPVHMDAALDAVGDVRFGVRPEDLRPVAEGEAAIFEGRVTLVEALGEAQLVYLDLSGEGAADAATRDDGVVVVKLPGTAQVRRGEVLAVTADPAALHLFGANGAALTRVPQAA